MMASQAMKGTEATTAQKSIRAFSCFSRLSPKWCHISFLSKWIFMLLCSIVLILHTCDYVNYQELSPPISVFVSAAPVEDGGSFQANVKEGGSEQNDIVELKDKYDDDLIDDDDLKEKSDDDLKEKSDDDLKDEDDDDLKDDDDDDDLKDEDDDDDLKDEDDDDLKDDDDDDDLKDEDDDDDLKDDDDDDDLEDDDDDLKEKSEDDDLKEKSEDDDLKEKSEDDDLKEKSDDDDLKEKSEDDDLNEKSDDEYFDSTSATSFVEADCDNVQKFPKKEIFKKQFNERRVYDYPEYFPENGMFKTMGFDRYVNVFGIPIVATKSVSDEALKYAVHVFAKFIDNDEDGIPDRERSVQMLHEYNTIIGYVSDPEESYNLWTKKFNSDVNLEFRNQFVCNIHFFEQWSSDVVYSKIVKEGGWAIDDEDVCSNMEDAPFDLSLWYFPFTIAYYGYLEDFDDNTIRRIEEFKNKAQETGVYVGGRYEEDEMHLADFFVWSLITYLGGLDCHCESDGINNIWKLCSSKELKDFNPEWFELLQMIEGLPKILPDGTYNSDAVQNFRNY